MKEGWCFSILIIWASRSLNSLEQYAADIKLPVSTIFRFLKFVLLCSTKRPVVFVFMS